MMQTRLTAFAAALGLALAPAAYAQQQDSAASPGSMQEQQQHDSQTVRQVQQQLKDQGHDIAVDGQMGPQTQAALKDFQQKQGLQASGRLDTQTIAALGVTGGGSDGAPASGSSSGAPSSEGASPSSGGAAPTPGSSPGSTGGSSGNSGSGMQPTR